MRKFGAKVVPIYIERNKENEFNLVIHDPLNFNESDSLEKITQHLNKVLEKMICQNPEQWIWTHDRWK